MTTGFDIVQLYFSKVYINILAFSPMHGAGDNGEPFQWLAAKVTNC